MSGQLTIAPQALGHQAAPNAAETCEQLITLRAAPSPFRLTPIDTVPVQWSRSLQIRKVYAIAEQRYCVSRVG